MRRTNVGRNSRVRMGLVSVSPGANGFGLSEGILLPHPRGGWVAALFASEIVA